MKVDFRMLGEVALYVDGVRVEIKPQQQCVLAVLLWQPGTVVPVEVLMDRVWSGKQMDPNRVHTAVNRLKNPLIKAGVPESWLPPPARASNGYMMNVPPECVDIHRFRKACAAAIEAQKSRNFDQAFCRAGDAIAAWNSPPFGLLDQDWIERSRQELWTKWLNISKLYVRLATDAGRASEILGHLLTLRDTEDVDEELHQLAERAYEDAHRVGGGSKEEDESKRTPPAIRPGA
jgi:DNA-binding SARP family transcriptional activator